MQEMEMRKMDGEKAWREGGTEEEEDGGEGLRDEGME